MRKTIPSAYMLNIASSLAQVSLFVKDAVTADAITYEAVAFSRHLEVHLHGHYQYCRDAA